jgi:NitT/TauT family transport system substrate-binding protein
MTTRRFLSARVAIACTALLGIIAAACGDDDSSSSATTAAAATSTTAVAAPSTATATTATPSSTAPAAHPDKVTIADIVPTAPFAARYAAMGMGAFDDVEKQFDLDIEFVEFGNGTDTLNAMLGGSADMASSAATGFIKAQGAGKDVTTVFAPFIGGGSMLIGAKKYEADRGTDLKKYDGATFGYTREGSSSQLYTAQAVTSVGLDWAKQGHVAFGQVSAAIPLLEAGRADVVTTDPSTSAQAMNSGVGYLILNTNDKATAEPLIGLQLGSLYGFNKSFVTKYPEVTQALTDAFMKGLAAVKKAGNDPAAVLALFPKDIQDKLRDGWDQAWPLTAPGVLASDGSTPDKALQDTVKLTETAGLLTAEEAQAATKVVDNSFVENFNG